MTHVARSAIVECACARATVRAKRSQWWSMRLPGLRHRTKEEAILETPDQSKNVTSRRSFLLTGAAIGAGTIGAGRFLADASPALAAGGLTKGDAAILRFLAAAELIETDLWQQYNELAGIQDGEVPGGSGSPAYAEAVAVLDEDMAQYIHDNTDDEISHAAFIDAYLKAHGEPTVNLDRFRTLPSSKATGAQQIGRLTNLMKLTVDTSFWTRYRSTKNPDFGATFPQAIPTLSVGQHPAIPRNDAELGDPNNISAHVQAIANTAGFHFAFIEQGGTTLYSAMAQKVTALEVLRVVVSIGPTEAMHFQTWHDKAGNAPAVTDGSLVFPDLTSGQFATDEQFEKSLIMPEPCDFLRRALPPCSIVRPTATAHVAMARFKR